MKVFVLIRCDGDPWFGPGNVEGVFGSLDALKARRPDAVFIGDELAERNGLDDEELLEAEEDVDPSVTRYLYDEFEVEP